jgi:hypothetical protein
MLDEKLVQVGHVTLLLFEFDQEGRDVGRAGLRLWAGPGVMRVAFGKVLPIEWAKQIKVPASDRAVADKRG